jgi:hypothetical protein
VSPVVIATQLLTARTTRAPVAAAAARFLAAAVRVPAALHGATEAQAQAEAEGQGVGEGLGFAPGEARAAVHVSVLFALVDAAVQLQRRVCAAPASAAGARR